MGASGHYRSCVEEALRLLDVKSFVVNIHDPSFPSAPEEDTGRGTPCSTAGLELARFFRGQGFTGLQLGPQGLTPAHSPSPYEGTLFSRDPLSISLGRLAAQGLIDREILARTVRERPPGGRRRVPYGYVISAHRSALRKAFETFSAPARAGGSQSGLAAGLRLFASEHEAWLRQDSLYDLLREQYGRAGWSQWDGPRAEVDRQLFSTAPGMEARCRRRRRELESEGAAHIKCYRFLQYLAHSQHLDFKKSVNRMGMNLLGDLQIGFSDGDVWSHRSLFLPRYLLGAPPSRTNPEGQPWGYPVLNPTLYRAGEGGAAAALLSMRMEKMFREFDAVRVDHPHGLVCPWVYREDDPDVLRAVRGGARLFSSPGLRDHPDLAPFAIPAQDQLNTVNGAPRYADNWIRDLTPHQVERYAILFDVLVDAALKAGKAASDLVPEVLSTLPYPLARVLERYGLGRFRVTQKADLTREDDVYRSENARPEDWIMVGNHDTRPIWLRLEEWDRAGLLGERAEYLAARLLPSGRGREGLRDRFAADPGLLAQAHFADLFASPAESVMVFFTDFFGMRETYNRPGVVSADNWSLRLPPDYPDLYRRRLTQNRAFNVPLALALALGTRGGEDAAKVASRLTALSGGPPFDPPWPPDRR